MSCGRARAQANGAPLSSWGTHEVFVHEDIERHCRSYQQREWWPHPKKTSSDDTDLARTSNGISGNLSTSSDRGWSQGQGTLRQCNVREEAGSQVSRFQQPDKEVVCNNVQIRRLTASMVEKHDWQSSLLRDPCFSRVDAPICDMPERSASRKC